MWRAIWRSIDRFSLQHFKHLVNELQEIKIADRRNRDLVVEILKAIVEIVTYGDRHDPSIFECFMEYQVLAEFLRILKISKNSSIEVPLLHCLSILIQNLASEHAIYYCFSNEYLNKIILHQYKFGKGDLVSYFVSFLRTVSGRLNRDTICLLVKVQEDSVISFPLYSEALKFACHEEKMIQIAVRTITLNIYNASDDMVLTFITTPPASEYFSDFVLNFRKQCLHLDSIVTSTTVDAYTHETRIQLHMETDKFIDDLYYCNDVIRAGDSRLTRLMTQNLLRSLVFPLLLPLLQLSKTSCHVSAITSLYVICRLLQVVDRKGMVNCVAVTLLYSCMALSVRTDIDEDTINGASLAKSFADHSSKLEEMAITASELEGAENTITIKLFRILSTCISPTSHFSCQLIDDVQSKRSGMLSLIFSENHSLLLATLMLLLILSETKDLDCLISSVMGFTGKEFGMDQLMASDFLLSNAINGNIFARHMPQILTALLTILVSEPPLSVITQWNAGWVLQKLLRYQETKVTDHDIDLFIISFKQSSEGLVKELNQCWFDYIPVTLESQWERCKRDLDESSQLKDPFDILEISMDKHISNGDMSSSRAWQRMVDAVKVFVLHHLLEAFIFGRHSQEDPFKKLRSASVGMSRNEGVDATYGTLISLGPGVPCKIAFSAREVRDVYLIPVAKGFSGKLLLAEKLPLHTHRGVIIAIAPLAGSSPKKDDNHPSWLHLRVREFDPIVYARNTGQCSSNGFDHVGDGRWTLVFSDGEVCDTALSLIMKEINKQRSSVESILAPLLQNNCTKNSSDGQGARFKYTTDRPHNFIEEAILPTFFQDQDKAGYELNVCSVEGGHIQRMIIGLETFPTKTQALVQVMSCHDMLMLPAWAILYP